MSTNKTMNINEIHRYSAFQCSVNWSIINKDLIYTTFSLFSKTKLYNVTDFLTENKNEIHTHNGKISFLSTSIHSIDSLKYYRFTIQDHKNSTPFLLDKFEYNSSNTTYRSSTIGLRCLYPDEIYSICVDYFKTNSTTMADIIICEDIKCDHLRHSVHDLLFVLTQYSIIFGILLALQGLFAMRKRRLAHIVHQHLINKTQRLRSSLSSTNLRRQSLPFLNSTNEQRISIRKHCQPLKKRITSSPALVLTEINEIKDDSDENEPFLKATTKNNVHFLLSLDEESDDNENISSPSTLNQSTSNKQHEPYNDQSNALLSMAHILDTSKPWSK